MNRLSVSVAPDGQYVVAAFIGLPYLFVFDDSHRHIHTIRFAGDVVKTHASNYLMTQPGIPGAGLRWLIPSIHVLNSEYVMVQVKKLWYVLRIKDDGSAVHVSTARLNTDRSRQIRNITAVLLSSEAQLHKGHLYVTNGFLPYILRYAFPN